jgi:small subunit ribosomal protein S20
MHIASTMRSSIRKVEKAIQSKQIDQARDLLKDAVPLIDKAASKGVIHENKAARHVSRITRRVNALLGAT